MRYDAIILFHAIFCYPNTLPGTAMRMTALLARWMYGTGRALTLNEQKVLYIGVWCSMRSLYIISHPHHVISKYTTLVSVLISARWLNVRNACHFGPKRTARTFVLLPRLCALIWTCFYGFDTVWGRNVTLMRHFIVHTHYCYVSLCWLDEQYVRCFVLLHTRSNLTVLLEFDTHSMAEVVISPSYAILLLKYTAMATTTLHWHSFLECMERVWCWP